MQEKNTTESKIIEKTALILEGGGMRGLFTTGVLDAFLDKGLHFQSVMGVSAGASHALSYLSRQRGRARRVNINYCTRSDYMGLKCLLTERSFFGMNLIFKKIPYEYDFFDFESFFARKPNYYAVATNIKTGEPEYLQAQLQEDLLQIAMASCSLPFLSQPITFYNQQYLDGGVGDSIPIKKIQEMGFNQSVLVLTQPKGYRKKIKKNSLINEIVSKGFYKKHPNFIEALRIRNENYNKTLEYIDQLEIEKKVLVLRPQQQEGLHRMERNPHKLEGLYQNGYKDTILRMDEIRAFVK